MSFEDIPNLIYTLFLVPLGFALQRIYSHSNKITKLETTQDIYVKNVNEICQSNAKLQKEVHELIGRVDEHLKNNKKDTE